jgi:hypothetical protein
VPVAVLFNVVLTWLFFRNIKETLIALTPLVTGVIWLAGFMAILDIPLDVVNIIGMVVVSGVIVDYGMGVTYEYRNKLKIGTVTAVSLSAITTILGSGVLLFASHPVHHDGQRARGISDLDLVVCPVRSVCVGGGKEHEAGVAAVAAFLLYGRQRRSSQVRISISRRIREPSSSAFRLRF